MLEKPPKSFSLRQQCVLLDINRAAHYYRPVAPSKQDILLMNELHEIWRRTPFYGHRKMTVALNRLGYRVGHKRVRRLMKQAGIAAIYPKPRTSIKNQLHAVYPYLLRDIRIARPNQAWQVDITYLRHKGGFMYLVSLIDMHSRYIVGWSLSNTLQTDSCLAALETSLKHRCPDIINQDQGCQFTSDAWVDALKAAGIKISMTGKGRCFDNSVPRAQGRLI